MNARHRFFAAAVLWGSLGGFAAAQEEITPPVDEQPESAKIFLQAWPMADLRREPSPPMDNAALKSPYDADPFQETQLLFCEEVRLREESGAWARVEAVEQPEFSHAQAWGGYPGWVLKKSLVPKPAGFSANAVVAVKYARLHEEPSKKSGYVEIPLGSRVSAQPSAPWALIRLPNGGEGWTSLKSLRFFENLPKDDGALRKAIVKTAELFVGEPYYWGGRCSHRTKVLDRPTGVDCSSLVNLAYRVNGVDVPRDAHEQYLKSLPLERRQMKPADLIFLAKADDPNRVVHVMLSLGDDLVLEAVQEFDAVRVTTVKNKLGKSLSEISPLEPAGRYVVYLGRLLPDPAAAAASPDTPR
ncbi:MAG TPA: NlpC/P60 family protein [Elusimicrobiota bacterium]|nr:NlpC/P60 family protein [Elusimicrobiota bacterium]